MRALAGENVSPCFAVADAFWRRKSPVVGLKCGCSRSKSQKGLSRPWQAFLGTCGVSILPGLYPELG
jgi:hypothetical protein